ISTALVARLTTSPSPIGDFSLTGIGMRNLRGIGRVTLPRILPRDAASRSPSHQTAQASAHPDVVVLRDAVVVHPAVAVVAPADAPAISRQPLTPSGVPA